MKTMKNRKRNGNKDYIITKLLESVSQHKSDVDLTTWNKKFKKIERK